LRPHVGVVDSVGHAEHFSDMRGVFFSYAPDVRRIGLGAGLRGVFNVEHVFERGIFRVRPVDEGDSLGAPFHPTPHAPVPEVYARAGYGVRPLGVYQHLIHERVFVHSGG
jgi:hypothetical protein